MDFSDPRLPYVAVALVLAGLARAAKAFGNGGALAGAIIGTAAALAYSGAGLALLGLFVVGGSIATKVGWERKARSGTAERGGGARDAARVVGKGGVTLAVALAVLFTDLPSAALAAAFAGSLAAALADTLGTEIGVLARGTPRLLPTLRPVPAGTPGAVSWPGTIASLGGACAIGAGGLGLDLLDLRTGLAVSAAGFLAALTESLVTTLVPAVRKLPGWVRNLLATGVGAGLAVLLA